LSKTKIENKSNIPNTLLRLASKWEVQLVFIIFILMAVGSTLTPYFINFQNQILNSKNLMEIAIMALPMALIIIATGSVDLSIANNLLMSAVVMAKLFEAGIPMGYAVLGGILTGTIGGFLNGILVGVVKLPPLVATLGTFTLFKGIGYALLKDFTVKGFPDAFNFIGQGKIPGTDIPFQLAIFAVFAVIYFFLLHRTALGRFIYSIGQNENACRYSGVPVDNVKILIFTLSGFMAALAGMVLAARYGSVDADIGSGYELTVITAVVLGGVLTTGGTGTLPGVFLSLWLVSEVRLLMNLLNIQGEIQKITFGLLLILAILLPRLVDRIRSRRKMKQMEKEILGA
jgi:rhamnose transport system permease protein